MKPQIKVGVARVDITPEYPIRLCGYATRDTECEGVEQRIWAKALAITSGEMLPAVLVSTETTVISRGLTEKVAARIRDVAGIPRERFVLCCTHTHTAPCVGGSLPNMFARDIPDEHREKIQRYTEELGRRLEQVALSAIADLQPATVSWAEGSVGFATNRRIIRGGRWIDFGENANGPVDHTMPVLVARGLAGQPRAILIDYACHCTTLGTLNRVSGDWAGYAQEAVEAFCPEATVLVTIGCGADSNPLPRGSIKLAQQYGREVANETLRLLAGEMNPLSAGPVCRLREFDLTLDSIPAQGEWEVRARRDDAAGYHARRQLERLRRAEKLPVSIPYTIQAWRFGDDLMMLFLGGEVVVDYALRLRKEWPSHRLWICAYANDVPCYIPSARILAEGGYEATESMFYYDQPSPLSPGVEERILREVQNLVAETEAV